MTAYARRDAAHAPIKAALLKAGVRLLDTARHHGLGCDLIAVRRDGVAVFLEVKNPGWTAYHVSKRGPKKGSKVEHLTNSEVELRNMVGPLFMVVTTPEEALRAVGLGTR